MALMMKTVPPSTEPNWMDRKQIAAELAKHGYVITAGTLAVKASKGGGPPFMKFGNRVMYDPVKALSWARARLVPNKLKL